MSGPLDFLASNTHLATRYLKFRTEVEPDHGEDLCFGLHLNLGAKFRTEIELLSLTKLCKNILPPPNLFNQQKIDAYAWNHYELLIFSWCTEVAGRTRSLHFAQTFSDTAIQYADELSRKSEQNSLYFSLYLTNFEIYFLGLFKNT